jgi:hypothetical protein
MRRRVLCALSVCHLAILAAIPVRAGESRTVARCGAGFLEEQDGQRILHLAGTPYEMGYQHGALLKEDVHALVRFLLDVKAKDLKFELGELKLKPDAKLLISSIAAAQKKFIPDWYYEELRGLADGSGVSYQEILICNFIPELFHCSGFALSGKATKDGTLYHGRILDYGCDWRLQEHATLIIARPAGKIPFVNVGYAGFIGSVTGMNARQVAIGEMGGGGLGHWAGVPMAILLRRVLEEANTLDEGMAIFRDNPRTCEYYYVLSDGKTGRAVGMEGSWNVFTTIGMGESHAKLPEPVADAVLLSAGDRYTELVRRVKAGYGGFDAASARALMDRPVAMKSNLHSVLFEPRSTKLWVAHASKEGAPAVTQRWHAFQLTELLEHEPETPAPVFEIRRVASGATATASRP